MKKVILFTLLFNCLASFSQEDLSKYGKTPSEQYSRKADELNAQSKRDLALEYANKAVSADSNYAYAFYVRGIIYIDGKKDHASALKDLNKAILLKAKDPDPSYILARGEIKNKLNDFKGAISDYEEVMNILESRKDTEFNQKYAKAFSGRGIAKCGSGDKKGGCEDMRKGKKLGDYDGESNILQYCK